MLVGLLMRGDLCPRRGCRSVLVIETNGKGQLVVSCPPCERNRVGLCRDCPAPLAKPDGRRLHEGWTLRCRRCALAVLAAKKRHAYRLDPTPFLASRRRSNAKPEVKARMKERHKAWRAANAKPMTPAERKLYNLYLKAWREKYYSDPANRERKKARYRKWRNSPTVRESLNARERARKAKLAPQIATAKAEQRRALVLSGQVYRLTKRDRQWLAEAGIVSIRTRSPREQRSLKRAMGRAA
jgi:hypothetical protein